MKPRFTLFLLCVGIAGCQTSPKNLSIGASDLDRIKSQIHLGGSSALMVGAAKVEITPPVGTPLAGYSKRRGKPSQGIRDPLFVRAVALSDGQDQLILVSGDLLIFPTPMAERIIQRICEERKLPRQCIILTATHTHSGSGGIAGGLLYEQVFGRYSEQIEEAIAARVSVAVEQAVVSSKPGKWAAANDPDLLEGIVENRSEEGGPIDPSLSVLMLEAEPRSPKAILVNAAAHPTLLEWRDYRLSGDFPGELSRRLEQAYPGSVCLFLNGAAGDSRPQDAVGENAEERVEHFGQALAEGAQGLISQIKPVERCDLSAWGTWIRLPTPQIRLGPVPIHPFFGRMMRPSSYFLNLAALEDWVLVPLPAEMTSELGLDLKKQLREQNLRPFTLGYSNGYLGYAVSAKQYTSGSYEAFMTWYGPNFGHHLIGHFRSLAEIYRAKKNAN